MSCSRAQVEGENTIEFRYIGADGWTWGITDVMIDHPPAPDMILTPGVMDGGSYGSGFMGLSDVEVTRDLSHAKVWVTVFEPDKARGTIEALNQAAGFLRRRLGQEMRIRSVPELHFHHDASVETGRRMDELIETAVSSDRHADEDEEPSA